jgi:hypothetical protein
MFAERILASGCGYQTHKQRHTKQKNNQTLSRGVKQTQRVSEALRPTELHLCLLQFC